MNNISPGFIQRSAWSFSSDYLDWYVLLQVHSRRELLVFSPHPSRLQWPAQLSCTLITMQLVMTIVAFSKTSVSGILSWKPIFVIFLRQPRLFGCLLLLYILATSKVISGRVQSCDSTHPWWLYSAALLGNQAAGAMTWYPTQSHYPDSTPTSLYPILIMLSVWLGSDKYQF